MRSEQHDANLNNMIFKARTATTCGPYLCKDCNKLTGKKGECLLGRTTLDLQAEREAANDKD